MTLSTLDLIARTITYPVAAAILVNQLDDAFVDANWLARGLHRRKRRVIPLKALRDVEQKRIAIMIPAWDESTVISSMLEHNLETIDYDRSRFEFFCGTYRNDADTQARVDEVARRHPLVHKVVVPHDGPTSKADCLNWVYQGIVVEEQRRGERFDILLMHDAEDVIHPLALRLYSHLIPPNHFVQTPVFSLELHPNELVAGTYIDEFAEHHQKDMLVRQALRGLIPSAGVGSAFDRDAFEEVAIKHAQRPFNPESMTEDYEIGVKFRLAGKRVFFACHSVEVPEEPATDGKAPPVREEYIATRAYFPTKFTASVRQRSRWILGITLQTARQVGWKGPLAVRYCFWRDRKGLANNLLVVVAYALFLYAVGRIAMHLLGGPKYPVDLLGPNPAPLVLILTLNAWSVLLRGGMKALLVGRLYGPVEALLSFPRMIVSNTIAALATTRALGTWARHRWTGEPLRWVKTAHVFPSADALRARRRLGELLLDRKEVASEDLAQALQLQRVVKQPIGDVLRVAGLVPARTITERLAEQLEMEVVTVDPSSIAPGLLLKVPEVLAEQVGALPLAVDRGKVRVAVAAPLEAAARTRLEEALGSGVVPCLCDAAELTRARQRAYRRLVELLSQSGAVEARLGDRLIALGVLDQERLRRALAEQAQTGELLGEILVRNGSVDPAVLSEALGHMGGFTTLAPDDGLPSAVRSIGYGFCALHTLVPLRTRVGGVQRIATRWRLHPATEAAIAARLGEPVAQVGAPGIQIRVALEFAGRLAGIRGGIDAFEADVLHASKLCRDSSELLAEARRAGASPIDHLLRRGSLTAAAAVAARAGALRIVPAFNGRIAVVREGGTATDAAREAVLPPGITSRYGIDVVDVNGRDVTLAAFRPTPAMVAAVALALPGWRIAWQVSTAQAERFAQAARDAAGAAVA